MAPIDPKGYEALSIPTDFLNRICKYMDKRAAFSKSILVPHIFTCYYESVVALFNFKEKLFSSGLDAANITFPFS